MTDTAAPLSLLLVDDEEGICRVMSMLLKDMGYAVRTASKGGEALALYEKERPAVVVSDIKMPGMDGITLLKEIKKRDPDAEVILLTGHGDMELAVAGLRHGAGDFLNKPASDAALEVALARARGRIAMREALRRHTEELEALVARRTAELIQSERFAAVGESAAALAHAIKNIAGALEGTMYVLEKGLELNKREYFEQGWQMVRGDVSRLRELAVGLLRLGRSTPLSFRPTAPVEPARAVAESIRLQAAQWLQLELLDEAGPEPFVMAPEAVHQCLLNLALNAMEALQEKMEKERNNGIAPLSQPFLSMRVKRERLADGSAAILYTVTDNGPGMPPEAAAATTSFQTGKKTGSGIGLFTTRKLVHEMGADLRFVSEQGQGTEAILRLNCESRHAVHPPGNREAGA